jgi:hypothetical protein
VKLKIRDFADLEGYFAGLFLIAVIFFFGELLSRENLLTEFCFQGLSENKLLSPP